MQKPLRQTKQKEIILQAVHQHGGHPSAEEVYNMLKEKHPKLSLATVYRNLNQFTEQGKLNTLHVTGEALHFDCNPHPHAHMVCRACGRITDLHVAPLLEELRRRSDFSGGSSDFEVEEVILRYEGICSSCKLKSH